MQRHVQRLVHTAVQMIGASVPGQQHFARCRAAYLLGGITGVLGTALLVPLLRLLDQRAAVAADLSI